MSGVYTKVQGDADMALVAECLKIVYQPAIYDSGARNNAAVQGRDAAIRIISKLLKIRYEIQLTK